MTFRRKFFEEMEARKDQLNDLGRMHWLSIQEKIYAPHPENPNPQNFI